MVLKCQRQLCSWPLNECGESKTLEPKVCSSENKSVIIPSQTNLALGSGEHSHQHPASASSTQINTDPMTVTNSKHGNWPEY